MILLVHILHCTRGITCLAHQVILRRSFSCVKPYAHAETLSVCVCVCVFAAGVPYVPRPIINSSLVVDKVLVGEQVMLKCFIHLPAGSAVEMSWASSAGSQVHPRYNSIDLLHVHCTI